MKMQYFGQEMKNSNDMIVLCVTPSRVVNNLIILPTHRLDKAAKCVIEFPQRTSIKLKKIHDEK